MNREKGYTYIHLLFFMHNHVEFQIIDTGFQPGQVYEKKQTGKINRNIPDTELEYQGQKAKKRKKGIV